MPTRLLGGNEPAGSPAWSPDGRWIAFDTTRNGNVEIYVISPEGGAPRRLTNHPSNDMIVVLGNSIYEGFSRGITRFSDQHTPA
jgi:Tol biopolymer transport system component